MPDVRVAALPPTRCALSDFLISVEFWWDGKLFGATCGEPGSPNCPFRQVSRLYNAHWTNGAHWNNHSPLAECGLELGNIFGPEYPDAPFCVAAHGTDQDKLERKKCFLRIFVCNRTSYSTQLIYEGGLDFSAPECIFKYTELVAVGEQQVDSTTRGFSYDTTYTVYPYLVEPFESFRSPLGGTLRLEFAKMRVYTYKAWTRVDFPPTELASVLALLTLTRH